MRLIPAALSIRQQTRTPQKVLAAALIGGLSAGLMASVLPVASAQADESAAARKIQGSYEMPFPCGEAWSGTSRKSHSPSKRAVDWNRPGDDGDLVVAAAGGVVSVANKTGRSGYGRYVQITHPNRERTLYAHLSNVVVSVGQTVDQGTLIGQVGSTGNVTGSHLHFEELRGKKVRRALFSGRRLKYDTTPTSGNCVDSPLAANMVGSLAAERVLFRRDQSASFVVEQRGAEPIVIPFGLSTDDPVLGDWDGNGTADAGVRRAADGVFYLSTTTGVMGIPFGSDADKPVVGDWNGDGYTDIGVHRSSTAEFFLRGADGSVSTIALGDRNDAPVTGDWDGDGTTDVGVYDSAKAKFKLLYTAADGTVLKVKTVFGSSGDLPVVGDWDGNGTTDLGIWRPSTGSFFARRAPSARVGVNRVDHLQFGRPRR